MSKENQLLRFAETQQGYFTSRQAERCGFARSNFPRKLRSGKWFKTEARGVYQLANYPFTPHSELALWTLWSANREGIPQGVWTHETALEIHGLSDISPNRLHLTVPSKFRKSSPIPKAIHLHFSENIPPSDIEIREGYKVTTPIRTLRDIIQQGSTQPEQVELAILDLAVQKSLIKGLFTIQEMENLQKLTNSHEMQKVIAQAIDTVWTRANTQLSDLGRMIEPYTIGISLDDKSFGTAVLCQYRSKFFFLTAAHVGRSIRKAKSIKMLLRFDNIRREYPSQPAKDFNVIEWDPTFEDNMLDDVLQFHPKDIAIVTPPPEIINTLKIYKAFYEIETAYSNISMQDALISLGGIEPTYPDNQTCQLHIGPYGFVASHYQQTTQTDYIVCPVSNHTYEIRNLRRKAISSFRGLSGSGLWKFANNVPSLVGIAIAESSIDPSSKLRNIYFHGPHSILSALTILGKTNEHKH